MKEIKCKISSNVRISFKDKSAVFINHFSGEYRLHQQFCALPHVNLSLVVVLFEHNLLIHIGLLGTPGFQKAF